MLMCPGCHIGLSTTLSTHLQPTTLPAALQATTMSVLQTTTPLSVQQQQLPVQQQQQQQQLPALSTIQPTTTTTTLPVHHPATLPTLQPTPTTAHPGHYPTTTACPSSGRAAPCFTSVGHCMPSAHFIPGVQTPYVCGRMFQVPNGMAPCMSVPHSACHMLCCLSCPHACPSLRTCAATHGKFSSSTCGFSPEIRTNLHTSGGGLIDGQKEDRSVSPDTKINYPVSLNPFKMAEPPTSTRQCASEGTCEGAWTAAGDSQVLMKTRHDLEESGWYYGALSWQQAATLLKDTSVGTFLVRDSASPQCLYSLSVQTAKGPTSARIHYSCGKFRLDCTGHSQKHMPEFNGVVELAQHYIHANSSQVWVDHEGKTFSPINIRQPLRRKAPSLQHLCRLSLNSSVSEVKKVLPPALRGFLDAYPHTC